MLISTDTEKFENRTCEGCTFDYMTKRRRKRATKALSITLWVPKGQMGKVVRFYLCDSCHAEMGQHLNQLQGALNRMEAKTKRG